MKNNKKISKIWAVIFIVLMIICFMGITFVTVRDFLTNYIQIILFICAVLIFAALKYSIYHSVKKKKMLSESFLNYITKLSGDDKEKVREKINEILDENGISAFSLDKNDVANFIFREYFNQNKKPTMVVYKEGIGNEELEILKKYPVRKIFFAILIAVVLLFVPFVMLVIKLINSFDIIVQIVAILLFIAIYFAVSVKIFKINNNKYSSKLYSYIHTVADYISLQTGVSIDSVFYKLYALRNKYTSDDFKNDSVKRIIEEYNKIYVD